MFRRSYSHKVVHVDATKACVALLILNLGTRREVGGQDHASAALLPEMNPFNRLDWPHSRYGRLGEEENFFPTAWI